jgi:hypothetical protein
MISKEPSQELDDDLQIESGKDVVPEVHSTQDLPAKNYDYLFAMPDGSPEIPKDLEASRNIAQ